MKYILLRQYISADQRLAKKAMQCQDSHYLMSVFFTAKFAKNINGIFIDAIAYCIVKLRFHLKIPPSFSPINKIEDVEHMMQFVSCISSVPC